MSMPNETPAARNRYWRPDNDPPGDYRPLKSGKYRSRSLGVSLGGSHIPQWCELVRSPAQASVVDAEVVFRLVTTSLFRAMHVFWFTGEPISP